MKTVSIDKIRQVNPCYSPTKHIPEGWVGTALDLCRIETIPAWDLLWLVLRPEFLDPTEIDSYCNKIKQFLPTNSVSYGEELADKKALSFSLTVKNFLKSRGADSTEIGLRMKNSLVDVLEGR